MELSEASRIIKALADGINPYTGELLEADNICQQPQTIRALYTLLQAVSEPEPTSKSTDKPQRQGQAWDHQEDQKLVALYKKNVPISALAGKHKRSKVAIKSRLKHLGLIE